MPAANELRLFLSSTFVDFLGERDYLAKKVFPALRRQCRDRGIEFTEIDLRWGLTDEDAEQGRILGTCFDEIDLCRPFFVGLLGERYGWVPPLAELAKNPELGNKYPWVEASMRAGHSATEMEFRHGFLNDGAAETKPLVYFRSAPDGSSEDPRVTRLKDEVTARLGSIPLFHSPAELGAMIESDLTALIEREWPASAERTWIDEERAGHAAFAQSRRKGYVANLSMVDRLNAHLEEPGSVLILTGESGAGKSSLLSYWAETLRERPGQRDRFIIEHFVGVTPASTDPDTLMRRIISEIRERIHSDEPIPQSSAELAQAFPSWLGRVSEEPLLIIVDAINQFNTEGRFLSWLPDYVSSNMKWVLSSTESEALIRLRERARVIGEAWPEVVVQPITLAERRRVLQKFLAGYQKKLRQNQEEKIVNDSKSSNPLFLRTLLEELRLQGKHEEMDDLIEHYLSATDIPDLFKRILERLEFDYGAKNVRLLLTRIWAAPFGLSESEILGSTKVDRADLSHLLTVFDYHLIRLKGRLSFFHDHLRMGVEGRYLDTSAAKEHAWTELAQYFEGTEASGTKALSLPWLWQRAGHWESLKHSLLDISLLPFLTEGSRSYELLAYWIAMEKQYESRDDPKVFETSSAHSHWKIDIVTAYEAALHDTVLDPAIERTLRHRLALFFRNAGWHEGAATNAKRALWLCEQTEDDTRALLALKIEICTELGKAYLDRAELSNAAEILEKALTLLGDPHAAHAEPETIADLAHLNVRNEYARLLKDQGKYPDAEAVSRVTLHAATQRFGPNHPASQNEMRLLAQILALESKYVEAETLNRKVLKSIEASLGPESLEAGYYLNQLAHFIQQFGGDYIEAQHLFERAVQIIERRLGDKHPDLAVLLQNFGSLHSLNGKWEQAEPLFLRSLSISETAHGPNHPAMATSLNNYAGLLFSQQKYEQAEEPYRRALDINLHAYGDDHPITAGAYTNLGNLLGRLMRYEEAVECYKHALKIRMETIGLIHVDTARTLFSYGRVRRLQGNLLNAERLLRESFVARKQIPGTTHPASIVIAVELAEVLLEQHKMEDLSSIIREIETLEPSNHPMAGNLKERIETLNKRLSDSTILTAAASP